MVRKSLHFKINIAILITGAAIALLMGPLIYLFEGKRRAARYEEIEVFLDTLFQQKRNDLANEIFAAQDLALARTLTDMEQVKGVADVTIYSMDGTPILSTAKAGAENLSPDLMSKINRVPLFTKHGRGADAFAEYAALIEVIGTQVGYFRIRHDLAALENELSETRLFFAGLIAFMIMTMLLLLNWLLYRTVVKPAAILRDGIRRVQEGGLGEQVALPLGDEIGQTAADFNAMSKRLQQQHIALQQAIETKDTYALRLEESNVELERLNQRLEEMVESRTAALHRSNDQLRAEMVRRKQAQEEIQRLNLDLERRVVERTAQLEAANKELEAFSYSVSHDLRAPLRHIDGYVDLLIKRCRDQLPEKGRHYLDTIADAARQMGVLIDSLLHFSRIGRSEMRWEHLDMNRIVGQAVARLKEAHPRRAIQWTIADLPAVMGDEVMLHQAWTNLLENAVKYTRPRAVATIAVGVHQNNSERIFAVRDNGVGFDMAHAGKLFGVFQRLHSQECFEGTGIGLANVQRIITRHGGRLWAEAEPDRGAAFFFSLPAPKEEIHARIETDSAGRGQSQGCGVDP